MPSYTAVEGRIGEPQAQHKKAKQAERNHITPAREAKHHQGSSQDSTSLPPTNQKMPLTTGIKTLNRPQAKRLEPEQRSLSAAIPLGPPLGAQANLP